MRAALVGGGPASFYAASSLLRRFPSLHVDILESLPAPFGLVRYGVSPDHPATKNVIHQFSRLMRDNSSRLSLFGNVHISANSSMPPLNDLYNLTIHASGPAHPRTLPITYPSTHVFLAHHLLSYFNSHPSAFEPSKPAAETLKRALASARNVTVIGAGNVAIDIARLLLRSSDSLCDTDMAPHAVEALNDANVEKVTLIARKPPTNVAWTTPALREIVNKIPGIVTVCDHELVKCSADTASDIPRAKRSMLKILQQNTQSLEYVPKAGDKILNLQFEQSPLSFEMKGNEIAVKLHHQGSDTDVEHITDLVFLSLGYIPGRQPHPSVGWAGEAATGIIGDNKWNAESVVSAISEASLLDCASRPGIEGWLKEINHPYVSWDDWQRVDEHEVQLANFLNGDRPRVKLTTVDEMLRVAHSSTADSIRHFPPQHPNANTHEIANTTLTSSNK